MNYRINRIIRSFGFNKSACKSFKIGEFSTLFLNRRFTYKREKR